MSKRKKYGPRYDGSAYFPISFDFGRDYSEEFLFNGQDWSGDTITARAALVPNGSPVIIFAVSAIIFSNGASRFFLRAGNATTSSAALENLFNATGESVELFWDMQREYGNGVKETVLYGPCIMNGSLA